MNRMTLAHIAAVTTGITCLLPRAAAADPLLADRLQSARLPRAYTLTFRVEKHEVANKFNVQARETSLIQTIDEKLKTKEISAKEADALRAQAKKKAVELMPPQSATITLSTDGERLLFTVTQDGITRNALFDGKRTITAEAQPEGNGLGSMAQINNGFRIGSIGLMPLLPLEQKHLSPFNKLTQKGDITQARVPLLDSAPGESGKLLLSDGQIEGEMVEGMAQVRRVATSIGGTLTDEWVYADHIRFGDAWLPKKITQQKFYGEEAGKPLPSETVTWTLEKSEQAPLAAAQFTPENWIAAQSHVQSGNGEKVTSFVFNKKNGTLDDQMNATVAGTMTTPPPPSSGLALVVVLAGLGGFYWWRTKGRQVNA